MAAATERALAELCRDAGERKGSWESAVAGCAGGSAVRKALVAECAAEFAEMDQMFADAMAAVADRESRARRSKQEQTTGLESKGDALTSQQQSLEELQSLKCEAEETLHRFKGDCRSLDERMAALAQEERQWAREEQDRFPKLQAKKNALYRVTRIEWDKAAYNAADARSVVKGFVINVAKNDLHPFRMEGSGDDTTRNLIWEYIAAGAGAKWRKVMQKQ